jgi:hypothetical protein
LGDPLETSRRFLRPDRRVLKSARALQAKLQPGVSGAKIFLVCVLLILGAAASLAIPVGPALDETTHLARVWIDASLPDPDGMTESLLRDPERALTLPDRPVS